MPPFYKSCTTKLSKGVIVCSCLKRYHLKRKRVRERFCAKKICSEREREREGERRREGDREGESVYAWERERERERERKKE